MPSKQPVKVSYKHPVKLSPESCKAHLDALLALQEKATKEARRLTRDEMKLNLEPLTMHWSLTDTLCTIPGMCRELYEETGINIHPSVLTAYMKLWGLPSPNGRSTGSARPQPGARNAIRFK